ncbi:hypothetical protein HADU_03943 [Acinetobacter sp. HA]|nr:KilA-N domain-containing protein [Acinetobacter sp. HA]EIM39979.1 hypothetical protein HADU_03943 [Acinetobacter sp. HA]
MKSTDNKKAQNFGRSGLIVVNNMRKLTMSNLTQNFANPNNQPLVIGEFTIRQDDEGRYCLNDLHKASGGLDKHRPTYFIRNDQTKDLISELQNSNSQVYTSQNIHCENSHSAVKVVNGGSNRGTYVVEDLVYSYAMWISAKFHLIVIRAYKMLVTQWKINDRQSISPEQQALLHEIVARRSSGERKVYSEMWARHNRHFKIPRYAELLAIHFPESVHYLETMELKSKVTASAKTTMLEVDNRYHQDVQGLAWHMLWIREWWKEFGEPLRKLNPNMAGAIHDHFANGAAFAYHFIDKDELKKHREFTEYFQWNLSSSERMALKFKR